MSTMLWSYKMVVTSFETWGKEVILYTFKTPSTQECIHDIPSTTTTKVDWNASIPIEFIFNIWVCQCFQIGDGPSWLWRKVSLRVCKVTLYFMSIRSIWQCDKNEVFVSIQTTNRKYAGGESQTVSATPVTSTELAQRKWWYATN